MPDGVQGYDRYAYGSNNPLKYIDPSGHDDIPWWAMIKFLAGQLAENGRLSDGDWKQAANTYIPASEKGSNLTVQASGVIPPAAGVIEANYVTTADGDFQLYITSGGGVGGGAGISIGYSQGAIYGDGFANADSFEGMAGQGGGGLNLPVVLGGSVDAWGGLEIGEDGGPALSGVNGYDAGVTAGTPGFSGAITLQNAVPAGDVVNSLLTDTGLIDTHIGQAYNDYAQSVTSFRMNGFGLFACRVAQQCGRWSLGKWSSDD